MQKFLVFQTDFGLVDGAVSAMEGVAYNVCKDLNIKSLTHEISPYNIFEASYRLGQTCSYWPSDSVFVSVVDPGVGSKRNSICAKLKNGQFFISPNNGTITHLFKTIGIESVREISEVTNRLKNSEKSYTFHGRDVYAYTGARLACGQINFLDVGPLLNIDDVVLLDIEDGYYKDNTVYGKIDILDIRFGSLWTNISINEFKKLDVNILDKVEITIYNDNILTYQNIVTYGRSFADVMVGAPILYMNSLYNMGLAINQGSFSKAYNIGVGNNWKIEIKKTI